jgi:hypothetical protein
MENNNSSKTIKLTESKLRGIIQESVRSALNEISYGWVQGAYDKMKNSGQDQRASNLDILHSNLYDTEDYQYDLRNGGSIVMNPDHEDGRGYIKYINDPSNANGRHIARQRNPVTNKFDIHRTTEDPRRARRQASAMNRFTGTNDYKPQDFRL